MIRRMTAAMVVAMMLAAPAMAYAAGPNDKNVIYEILTRIGTHSCEAANQVAQAWGFKGWMCAEKPTK
jgi:hypothetical protein